MCADTPTETHSETPDYKSTLNLPKTDFPMRAGLPKREPEWLARWERIGIYDRLREKAAQDAARAPFTLHDGPPYANGHLHIGHALNKILKDMVVRSQQMMGRDARYIPGWDCHGLPIEWKIEEKYRAKGRDKDEVPVVEFRRECRDFAAGWIDVQREEFKRLGVTGNWADPYLTMDFHAERVIAEEFQKFLMNGTLYLGSKPVMWSPVEQTALAEAEVEYHDKESFTVWVKFAVTDFALPDLVLSDEEETDSAREAVAKAKDEAARDFVGAHVVIWTTTPWTIPSNRGVVFGVDYSYGLYEVTDTPAECWAKTGDRFILADRLAGEVMRRARLDEGMYRRVRDVTQAQLAGMTLAHPLAGAEGAGGEWDAPRDFRAAPFVTDEEGTGFVHCAPSHGMEEYELYRDLGMLGEVITYNVLDDGSFRADLPFFGGTRILKPNGKEGDANAAVIDKLIEVGGLLARGKIKHSYPHCWRSKAPVIYRNTPQWFAAIDRPVGDGQDEYGTTIRERALTSIDKLVTWTPASGRNRLYSMIEARPDWVLSRQRAWGVPLTCFTRRGARPTDADFLLRDPAVNARILEAFEAEGADAWYEDGAKERFLGNDHNPDDFDQVFDILDVWFDSGSTHAFVLRDRADGSEDGHGRSLPGRHRPAPRLVPFLDAAGLRHHRPRALSRRADPRLHAGREGHQDVQVARQHHRPRGGGETVRRRHPAALGGADRLYQRPAHRARDPQGCRRQLSPAAQHHALPAGRARRFLRKPTGSRPRRCRNWSAGCCTGWPSSTTRCARAMPPTTSRACSRRSSPSPRSISAPSISTSARTRSIATATPPAAGRRAPCWTSSFTG